MTNHSDDGHSLDDMVRLQQDDLGFGAHLDAFGNEITTGNLVSLMRMFDGVQEYEEQPRTWYMNRVTVARFHAPPEDRITPLRPGAVVFSPDTALEFLLHYAARRHYFEDGGKPPRKAAGRVLEIPPSTSPLPPPDGKTAYSPPTRAREPLQNQRPQRETARQEEIDYHSGMDLRAVLADEGQRESFRLDWYNCELAGDDRISSSDLHMLMVLSDLEHGIGVCDADFYRTRIGIARQDVLKGKFTGYKDQSDLRFTGREVLAFFNEFYLPRRPQMRQDVSSPESRKNLQILLRELGQDTPEKEDKPHLIKDSPPVIFRLDDGRMSTLAKAVVLEFGGDMLQATIAVDVNRNFWGEFDIPYLPEDFFAGTDGDYDYGTVQDIRLRLYYTPDIVQDKEMLRALLVDRLGSQSITPQQVLLTQVDALLATGCLMPCLQARRSLAGQNVLDFLHRLNYTEKDGSRPFRERTLRRLRTHYAERNASTTSLSVASGNGHQRNVLIQTRVISRIQEARMPFDPSFYYDDFQADPDKIEKELRTVYAEERVLLDAIQSRHPDSDEIPTFGLRRLKKLVGTYLDYSGKTEDDSHLRDAFTGKGREDIVQSVATPPVSIDGFLQGFYGRIQGVFDLKEKTAYKRVHDFFGRVGLLIGEKQAQSLLAGTRPIFLTGMDEEEEIVTVLRFSSDAIDHALYARYGNLVETVPLGYVLTDESVDSVFPHGEKPSLEEMSRHFDHAKPGRQRAPTYAENIVRAFCSYYTEQSIPPQVVEDILQGIGRQDVPRSQRFYEPEMLRLAAELTILKYGLIDSTERIPDLDDVRSRYTARTGNELDMADFVIRDAKDTSLILDARLWSSRDGSEALLHSSTLAQYNPVLWEVVRGSAERGDIPTVQVQIGKRPPELCYRMGDVMEIARNTGPEEIQRLQRVARYVQHQASFGQFRNEPAPESSLTR